MSSYSKKVDDAITSATTLNNSSSELSQLSKLLSDKVLNEILHQNIIHRNNPRNVGQSEISVTWIDKITLAKMTENTRDHFNQIISAKVELADALFVDINNSSTTSSCSAFLFQAKRAKTLELPVVPVYMGRTINNSSLKELTLLSQWPRFDLFPTSRSHHASLHDITLPKISTPPPYGWFGVCPPSLTNHNWKAHWMCSQAVYGSEFQFTMGELLEFFYLKNGMQVGEHVDLILKVDPWSQLISKILAIAKTYSIPMSYISAYGEERTKITKLMNRNSCFMMANLDPKLKRFGIPSAGKSNSLNQVENIKGKFPVIKYENWSSNDFEERDLIWRRP